MTPTPEATMPVLPEHDPARLMTPERRAWLADNIFVNPHAGEPIRFDPTTPTPEPREPSWHHWDDDAHPTCDLCQAFARWSVARFEDDDARDATVRWFACGTHLNRVLTEADWLLDAVMIYDLTGSR